MKKRKGNEVARRKSLPSEVLGPFVDPKQCEGMVGDLLLQLGFDLENLELDPSMAEQICGVEIPQFVWEMAVMDRLTDLQKLGEEAQEAARQVIADWRGRTTERGVHRFLAREEREAKEAK